MRENGLVATPHPSAEASRGLHAPPESVVLALFVFAHAMAWTIVPLLGKPTLFTDVAEGFAWGREWVLMTYKHPALPSWCLEIARMIAPGLAMPAYLTSQLFVAVTLVLVWRLGSCLFDSRSALAGVLLLEGLVYFTSGSTVFNHNTAQLPFWAGVLLCLWQAVEAGRAAWWIALGLVGAGAMHAKFSAGLILLLAANWILWDPVARRRLRTPGPYIALGTFLVLVAPLASKVIGSGFAFLDYMQESIEEGSYEPVSHITRLLTKNAAFFILAAIGGLAPRLRPHAGSDQRARRARAFLIWFNVWPALAFALLAGTMSIHGVWAEPFFTSLGLLAVALAGTPITRAGLNRLTAATFMFLVLHAGWMMWRYGRDGTEARLSALPFVTVTELAGQLDELWRAQTGQHLGLVGGDPRLANLVVAALPSGVSVFTDLDRGKAPWVTPYRLESEGVLAIWPEGLGNAAHDWPVLAAARETGTLTLALPPGVRPATLTIGYAIIPPEATIPTGVAPP